MCERDGMIFVNFRLENRYLKYNSKFKIIFGMETSQNNQIILLTQLYSHLELLKL